MYHLRSQGIVAQDCVKVLIDEDNDDGTSKKSLYFGKCVAFLQDSEGKQFVVLQWFTRHEDNGFDMISKVPSFKLAPEGHTKSYSTLPLDAILNGAVMVPGGGRFWALLSPREQKLYTNHFQWVVHLFVHVMLLFIDTLIDKLNHTLITLFN